MLLAHWRQMAKEFAHPRLFLAGKSMGGRMAAELYQDGEDEMNAAGLLILGYPFHPPANPDRWRGDVLKQIKTPTLLLQGIAILSAPVPNWLIFPSHPPYRSIG